MLGAAPPDTLVEARLQLHHAAQLVAAAGATLLEPQPDDSHPNFGWSTAHAALMGRVLPGARARTGLRVADLTRLLVDEAGDRVRDELTLHRHTLDEGYTWLADVLKSAGAPVPTGGLAVSTYQIPSHPTGAGAPFELAPRAAFSELARWFANGHEALGQIAAASGASEVRCWPHHFDLGALAVLATEPDGSLAKSIGMGLSPGDDGYAEPYWYVSPWPYPDASSLPPLGANGHWHTEGHTSAILTGSELLASGPEHQAERLRTFLAAAMDASRNALGH